MSRAASARVGEAPGLGFDVSGAYGAWLLTSIRSDPCADLKGLTAEHGGVRGMAGLSVRRGIRWLRRTTCGELVGDDRQRRPGARFAPFGYLDRCAGVGDG